MAEDSGLFHEIDDSLRVEKLQQLWQRFGNIIIAGCAGIVVFTILSAVWKNHLHEVHMKQTALLLQAQELTQSGKFDEAAALLEKGEAGENTFTALARLRRAEALVNAGKPEKALAVYKEVGSDRRGVDNAFVDLARIQASIITDNHLLPEDSPDALKDAAKEGRPFNGIANELMALQLVKDGKYPQARDILKQIADNDYVPHSERTRAAELMSTIPEDKK